MKCFYLITLTLEFVAVQCALKDNASTGKPNSTVKGRLPGMKFKTPSLEWINLLKGPDNSHGKNYAKIPETSSIAGSTPCINFLSPCSCKDSVCCGAFNDLLNVNCFNFPIGLNSVRGAGDSLQIPANPCMNNHCAAGLTCHTVSLVSLDGNIMDTSAKCCSASQFSDTNCGQNVNCQERNGNGTYTACCNGSCSG